MRPTRHRLTSIQSLISTIDEEDSKLGMEARNPTAVADDMVVYQLFLKKFNGETLNLKFTTPTLSTQTLIAKLQTLTLIPNSQLQSGLINLLSENRLIGSTSTLCADPQTRLFPSITLLCKLLGGKGGFGSLLRGAATKAGQKKTNNFDACRDMSGRRFRHVNAEKKLEEWKEGEEERRLEKVAEEFLKKKAKSFKVKAKGGNAEKYVEKYRAESAKCVKEVESAVREAFERERKRKAGVSEGADAKKLKIWLGKRKIDENDDMEDDSSDEEDQKSAVINNQDGPNKGHDSISSVSDGGFDGDLSSGSPVLNVENNDLFELQGVSDQLLSKVEHVEGPMPENKVEQADNPKPDVPKLDKVEIDTYSTCVSLNVGAVQMDGLSQKKPEGEVTPASSIAILTAEEDAPINFDDYSTAAEMEVLGLERLKSELQLRGLKCGGTLQEMAARLFLLKTTPIEKLPKKFLVKK